MSDNVFLVNRQCDNSVHMRMYTDDRNLANEIIIESFHQFAATIGTRKEGHSRYITYSIAETHPVAKAMDEQAEKFGKSIGWDATVAEYEAAKLALAKATIKFQEGTQQWSAFCRQQEQELNQQFLEWLDTNNQKD